MGNIALVLVETPFELANHVDTICLPKYQENFDDRQKCFVKGWGVDKFGEEGVYQVVMMEVVHWSVPKRLMLMNRILRPFILKLELLPGELAVDRKTFPVFTLMLQLKFVGLIGPCLVRINSKHCLMGMNVTNGCRIN